MSQRSEIKAALISAIEPELEGYMAKHGFKRRAASLIYKRKINEATQIVDLRFEGRPNDNRDAAAAVYPIMEVQIPSVDECLEDMISGNHSLLSGVTAARSRQPIGFISKREDPGRWYIYQAASVPGVVSDILAFMVKWVMPFLDVYSTPEDILSAHKNKDGRMVVDRAHLMRVVAAALVLDRHDFAQAVMDEWLGAPGARKRYQQVNDYIEKWSDRQQ